MPVVHVGLWLDAPRRKDFEEAVAAAGQLLKLKPNFLELSRWLITRYVKFDTLVGRVEDGLAKAGLRVQRR